MCGVCRAAKDAAASREVKGRKGISLTGVRRQGQGRLATDFEGLSLFQGGGRREGVVSAGRQGPGVADFATGGKGNF